MGQTDREAARPTAAYFWARRTRRFFVAGAAGTVVLACLSFANVPALLPQVVGIPLMAVLMVGFLAALLATTVRRNTEEQQGYTTFNGDARNLQQRNPYDGSLLRSAGEPYLESSEFEAILAATRARRTKVMEKRK